MSWSPGLRVDRTASAKKLPRIARFSQALTLLLHGSSFFTALEDKLARMASLIKIRWMHSMAREIRGCGDTSLSTNASKMSAKTIFGREIPGTLRGSYVFHQSSPTMDHCRAINTAVCWPSWLKRETSWTRGDSAMTGYANPGYGTNRT